MEEKFTKGYKYEIYIGLKDKDSYQEILDIEDFKKILCEICTENNICFTLLTQYGGYNHNKGYTTETSLRIVIIGGDEKMINDLGILLKKKVNTDTILISKMELQYAFLN